MTEYDARAARTAHAAALTALRPAPSGWRRAAEVAGLIAAGMLAAVGVIPW
ncbi:hypothetical protein B0I12_002524 [Microbacterium hydrothermale]|uniref:hypothetical protein n=1 Tax=Microbacterium hydrothermale TaxID=857427 RepID=UPI0022263418|nr:hypothetical protein [Microbacterium hydrothermale]MCW2165369.1 hypothetical protein [Microbacterium hydrothermale]